MLSYLVISFRRLIERDDADYGAKSIKASNADIATNAKPQTFEDFAATADWSKVLEG